MFVCPWCGVTPNNAQALLPAQCLLMMMFIYICMWYMRIEPKIESGIEIYAAHVLPFELFPRSVKYISIDMFLPLFSSVKEISTQAFKILVFIIKILLLISLWCHSTHLYPFLFISCECDLRTQLGLSFICRKESFRAAYELTVPHMIHSPQLTFS